MHPGIGTPALWIGFTALVLALLALDLGVLHRRHHEVGWREAVLWSVFWIGLALAFNLWMWFAFGGERALEFLTGYLIEKALSVDNIFVFLVIFSTFGIPRKYQYRVLFWGIIGALVMRALFIFMGAVLLHKFHWVVFVFGGFLLYTGFRIATQGEPEVDPENTFLARAVRRRVPMTQGLEDGRFVVRRAGRTYITPLMLVLLVVETTDVIFALDSIPAIFAVTDDPFIVYTSNIFAILGLRALFFLLSGLINRFSYLHVGLGLVLAFVGCKMIASHWYDIPIGFSLGVIALLLGGSVVYSLWKTRQEGSNGPRAGG